MVQYYYYQSRPDYAEQQQQQQYIRRQQEAAYYQQQEYRRRQEQAAYQQRQVANQNQEEPRRGYSVEDVERDYSKVQKYATAAAVAYENPAAFAANEGQKAFRRIPSVVDQEKGIVDKGIKFGTGISPAAIRQNGTLGVRKQRSSQSRRWRQESWQLLQEALLNQRIISPRKPQHDLLGLFVVLMNSPSPQECEVKSARAGGIVTKRDHAVDTAACVMKQKHKISLLRSRVPVPGALHEHLPGREWAFSTFQSLNREMKSNFLPLSPPSPLSANRFRPDSGTVHPAAVDTAALNMNHPLGEKRGNPPLLRKEALFQNGAIFRPVSLHSLEP